MHRVAALVLAGALTACGGASAPERRAGPPSPTTADRPAPSAAPAPVVPPPTVPPAPAAPAAAPAATPSVVTLRYRVERRTTDEATEGFASVVDATLEDPRGWQRAAFDLVRDDDGGEYLIVIAEGDEVDRLCLPHDTYGTYSCQREEVVAINADRWRTATAKWTGDLDTYRRMLVNHEVGHLLGQPHRRCDRRGRPAAVMVQQSTELDGCLPNPWPLDDEIRRAARHDRPLAPL